MATQEWRHGPGKSVMFGVQDLQKKLLQIAQNVNVQAVEDILVSGCELLEKGMKEKAPTNAEMWMRTVGKLPTSSDSVLGWKSKAKKGKHRTMTPRQKAAWLLMVNDLYPGRNEVKNAIHADRSRFVHPRAFVAADYRKSHGIYFFEYGKFGFPAVPYLRPTLTQYRGLLKAQIENKLIRLIERGVSGGVVGTGPDLGESGFGPESTGWVGCRFTKHSTFSCTERPPSTISLVIELTESSATRLRLTRLPTRSHILLSPLTA